MNKSKTPWYFAPAVFIAVVIGAFLLHSAFMEKGSNAPRVASAVQDPHYVPPAAGTKNFAKDASTMTVPAPIPMVQYVCLDSAVAHEAYPVASSYDTTTELEISISSPAQY